MAVLPPESGHALPPAYRTLMVHTHTRLPTGRG